MGHQVSCCNGHIPEHGGDESPWTGRSLPTLLVTPASPGTAEKATTENASWSACEASPRIQEVRNDEMTTVNELEEVAETSTSTEIVCQADSDMARSSSVDQDLRSAKTAMRMKARSEAQVKVRSFLRMYNYRGIREQRRPQRYLGTYSCAPLHDAVRKRDPHLVKLLLIAGADPFQADSNGRTPLRLAEQRKAPEQILYLLTAATRDGKRWVPWPRFKGSSDSLGSLSSCDMQPVTSAEAH